MSFQEPVALGADERSAIDRAAWKLIGPPLYYCEHCLRAVKVSTQEDGLHTVKRSCEHDTAQIIAPRRSILVGVGGVTPMGVKFRTAMMQAKSAITGRT